MYLAFGAGTTVIDFAVYTPLSNNGIDPLIANVIAWIFAVTFAYVTNRIFVFKSVNRGIRGIATEAAGFALGRLATLLMQEIIIFVMFNCLKYDELFVKIVATVVVVIFNYIFGKLLFRKK